VGTAVDLDTEALAEQISQRIRAGDYSRWRDRVEQVGGCSVPIHLNGEFEVTHLATGQSLTRRAGTVLAPCGNRRESVCPRCSDRYAADAFHLIRAGLSGGKGVPDSVAGKPRLFVTLTAPSFGPVHSRRVLTSGEVIRCRCGQRHHGDDPRVGTAIDPQRYDYAGAVLWQAHAGELWNRFTIRLRRELAKAAGIKVSEFAGQARISYAKVGEYQRRGLVHFHAIIRIDGPGGAGDPAPAWAHSDVIANVVPTAAASTVVRRTLPTGDGVVQPHRFTWGEQIDTRTIAPADVVALEDGEGTITDAALAGYIAKYATKGTTASETADRPFRSEADIDAISTTAHHRLMMRTAWDLGASPGLGYLRRWAHMLGFRGHFLTKSKHYSTRFGELRNSRRLWHYEQMLDRFGVTEDEITVVNHWNHVGTGYDTDAERELAAAIYERQREQRKTHHATETPSWNC
jgi:hypothetical protein